MTPGSRRTVSLEVPTDPAQIATIRSFAAAMGRNAALPEEAVDDLSLALSEIAAIAVEGDAGGTIRVDVDLADDGLEVTVSAPDVAPREGPSSVPDRRSLLEALFPSISETSVGTERVTRFRVDQG